MNPELPEFRLAIASDLENVDLVEAILEAAFEKFGLTSDENFKVGLAVREAVANAVQHGNQLDREKRVTIELWPMAGGIAIRIRDEGDGFDPEKVPDPLAPENLLKPNGRGILLMNKLMDEVEFDYHPKQGMLVTMRTATSSPEPQCQS
jgi:serine/threonine-protein kinase RsbW